MGYAFIHLSIWCIKVSLFLYNFNLFNPLECLRHSQINSRLQYRLITNYSTYRTEITYDKIPDGLYQETQFYLSYCFVGKILFLRIHFSYFITLPTFFHNFNLSYFISDLSTSYIYVKVLLLLATSYVVFTTVSYAFTYPLGSVKDETGSSLNIYEV